MTFCGRAFCPIRPCIQLRGPLELHQKCGRAPFKPAITEFFEQDPSIHVPVLTQRLRTLGYDGGETIVKDYVRALRAEATARRAYVRVEPGPGERFDVDWGHFGALLYNGAARKLYAFCLVEAHSRKMYLE